MDVACFVSVAKYRGVCAAVRATTLMKPLREGHMAVPARDGVPYNDGVTWPADEDGEAMATTIEAPVVGVLLWHGEARSRNTIRWV